jgi:hypothetical protein
MTDEVQQQESTVSKGGTQAGRDVLDIDIDASDSEKQTSRIQSLLKRIEEEAKKENNFNDIIDDLRYYKEELDEGKGMSLKEKLNKGDRLDNRRLAMRTKERFRKKVTKYTFLRSAQKLFVYLLKKVEIDFHYKVRPLINDGASNTEIDKKIYDEIISPISEHLGSTEVTLGHVEFQGMIYYLASKCLIKWHSE